LVGEIRDPVKSDGENKLQGSLGSSLLTRMQRLSDLISVSPASADDLRKLVDTCTVEHADALSKDSVQIDTLLETLDPAVYTFGYTYLMYVCVTTMLRTALHPTSH